MNKQPKFWMVYGIGCGRPTYQHNSRTSAEDEARRLARANPGTRFIVLVTIDCFEAVVQPPSSVKIGKASKVEPDDGIPF